MKEFSELAVEQKLSFETPPIEKVQLVKYAGASGDFNLIHTDEETAKKVGLPGVIVHGMINMGVLGDFVSQVVGNQGFVQRLQVRFSGMVRAGESLLCSATVSGKDEEKKTVDFELTAETEPGKVVTVGNATIQYT